MQPGSSLTGRVLTQIRSGNRILVLDCLARLQSGFERGTFRTKLPPDTLWLHCSGKQKLRSETHKYKQLTC
jgi:hypothetical protein